MSDDPNWPRASDWLTGDLFEEPSAGYIAILGAPVNRGSISGGRFDLAPAAIREALGRFSTQFARGDLKHVFVMDGGDAWAAAASDQDAMTSIRGGVLDLLLDDADIAILGGDNSITRPAVHGLARALAQGQEATPDRVGLITLDAHHDLRDTSQGLNNGNPVRALLEDGLSGNNVWQIGIQPFANSPAYAAVAREHGIHVVTVDDVRTRGIGSAMAEALDDVAGRVDAIYVDLDVDVLDRAFAPACPGARPGGLMPAELFEAARLAGAHPKVRAVDIVEVDPERDVADVTVLAAARCLLSFASGLATRPR